MAPCDAQAKIRELEAACAAKDARIAELEFRLRTVLELQQTKVPQHPDTARLDKLPACFHMLRVANLGTPKELWWLSYAPNDVCATIRAAIDAHQEPKP